MIAHQEVTLMSNGKKCCLWVSFIKTNPCPGTEGNSFGTRERFLTNKGNIGAAVSTEHGKRLKDERVNVLRAVEIIDTARSTLILQLKKLFDLTVTIIDVYSCIDVIGIRN